MKAIKLQLNNGVLTRYVDSKKHYFIKYRAYAYDESELIKYKGLFHTLRIVTSAGKIYEISATDFAAKSYLNNDYGKLQRLICVANLTTIAKNGKVVHLPMALYLELKRESERTGLPMTALLEVKKMTA